MQLDYTPPGRRRRPKNVIDDYGADPTGVAPADTAFANAAASSERVTIPAGTYNLSADVTGNFLFDSGVSFTGGGNVFVTFRGVFTDAVGGANLWKLRDRVLIGDGTLYTGNQSAPLGSDYLTTGVDPYFAKTSTVYSLSHNSRIGVLGGSQTPIGTGASDSIGVAGVSLNSGESSTGWGLYSDLTHQGNALVSYGIEIAAKNQGADITGNAYSLSGGVIGIHAVAGGDPSYSVGAATTPSTCAINLAKGSTAVGTWNIGIRFGSGAFTADASGHFDVMALAKSQQLHWMASSTVEGAKIRSDVTNIANQDVSLVFENQKVSFYGTGETTRIASLSDLGTTAVNYLDLKNAATANYPVISAQGTDTDVGVFYVTKGAGPHRFSTNANTGLEQFRISHVASAVNFLEARGATTGNPARLGVLGSDTNVDLLLVPKGSGLQRGVTPPAGDNSTALATTAFVQGELATQMIRERIRRLTMTP